MFYVDFVLVDNYDILATWLVGVLKFKVARATLSIVSQAHPFSQNCSTITLRRQEDFNIYSKK